MRAATFHRIVVLSAALATLSTHTPADAAFPGENGLLTFTRYAPGNLAGQVATAPAEAAAEVTDLTSTVALNAVSSWSPDGTCIAFYSERDGGDQELYVMGADGSAQTRLTVYPGFDYNPTFSPDGTSIVFASQRTGTLDRDIWVMDADGGNEAPLLTRGGSDSEPAYSPDGSLVVFSGSDGSGFGHIFVASSIDGSGLVQVTDLDTVDDRGPDWQSSGIEPGSGLCPTVTPGICGDASADGEIKASDALTILRSAVGISIVCPLLWCDTDSRGVVVASDALQVLQFSVGQETVLECPSA